MIRASSIAARVLRVVLVAALFAASSPHQHSGSVRPWAEHARDLVRSSTSHPSAPHHMERVELERAPHCPVCSLRDKVSAVRSALVLLRPAEQPAAAVFSSLVSVDFHRADGPSRPRGPPLA